MRGNKMSEPLLQASSSPLPPLIMSRCKIQAQSLSIAGSRLRASELKQRFFVLTQQDAILCPGLMVQSSLVPRPVRAIWVNRGGLEPSAIARGRPRRTSPTSLTGDVTSEIDEDDLERGWVQPCLNLSLNPHLPFNNHVTYNRDAGVARGSRCILPLPPSPVLRWIIHLQNRSKLTDKHMDKVRRIVNPQLNRSIFKF